MVTSASAPARPAAGGAPVEWMSPALQAHRERLTFTVVAGGITAIFAVFATVQAVFIHGLGLGNLDHPNPGGVVALRLVVNGISVVIVVVLARFGGVERQRASLQFSLIIAFAVLTGAIRLGLQVVANVYGELPVAALLIDFGTAAVIIIVAFLLALGVVVLQRRLHEREHAFVEQRMRASAALAALRGEELRVRREVSEGLHGTLQQRLVLLGTKMSALARELDDVTDLHSAKLLVAQAERLAAEIDGLREVDVRELSQLLYPSGIELGLAPAVRMMMRRVPATIATRVDVDEALAIDDPAAPQLSADRRLLVVRVLEEAVSNALRHGHAARLAVRLAVADGMLRLIFDDDGVGLPETGASLNGLSVLDERLRQYGGSITLERGAAGGARLTATLPLGIEGTDIE